MPKDLEPKSQGQGVNIKGNSDNVTIGGDQVGRGDKEVVTTNVVTDAGIVSHVRTRLGDIITETTTHTPTTPPVPDQTGPKATDVGARMLEISLNTPEAYADAMAFLDKYGYKVSTELNDLPRPDLSKIQPIVLIAARAFVGPFSPDLAAKLAKPKVRPDDPEALRTVLAATAGKDAVFMAEVERFFGTKPDGIAAVEAIKLVRLTGINSRVRWVEQGKIEKEQLGL